MIMSRIRFYLDENMAKEVADGLRTRSIDVITTPEIGHMGFTDEEHLAYAQNEGRVFVTQDEDFLILHSKQILMQGLHTTSLERSPVRTLFVASL